MIYKNMYDLPYGCIGCDYTSDCSLIHKDRFSLNLCMSDGTNKISPVDYYYIIPRDIGLIVDKEADLSFEESLKLPAFSDLKERIVMMKTYLFKDDLIKFYSMQLCKRYAERLDDLVSKHMEGSFHYIDTSDPYEGDPVESHDFCEIKIKGFDTSIYGITMSRDNDGSLAISWDLERWNDIPNH